MTDRKIALRKAEQHAVALFDAITKANLIRPGRTELEVNEDIHALAQTEFGVHKHWHKRIVRAGRNTLCPYDDNPDDLVIQADDIVFIDLGPVFEEWEADFGRTYVLGDDPAKHQIVADGEACWAIAKAHFDATPNVTSADLFTHVEELAKERGWTMGQWHTGHLVGDFPHARPPEKVHNFVMPGNDQVMRDPDANGEPRDWILEVHFVDAELQIGSFFEQLLTVA